MFDLKTFKIKILELFFVELVTGERKCYLYLHMKGDQKITVILNFCISISIYLFIDNNLVLFKVTPLRCNTLMSAFFPILLKRTFVLPTLPVLIFLLSPQS